MATLGFDVFRFQRAGYVIAGAVGGLAGFLLANATEFVSPAYMSWQRSGELIIMVLFGGIGSLHGAIVGAAGYLLIEEILGGVTEQWKLIFGPLLVLVVLFARGGLLGLAGAMRGRLGVADPMLEISDLRKNFGGLVVTDGVTLEIGPGELHAVIGPNGAGKTTLINQISGLIAPAAGTAIHFNSADITDLPANVPSWPGAIVSNHFGAASILRAGECCLGRAGAQWNELSFLRGRIASNPSTTQQSPLAEVGLAGREHTLAEHLSHGEKRALELAVRSPCSRNSCCLMSRWPAPDTKKVRV